MSGASKLSLETQFMREVNRCADSDRTTKKRGLQKLLESLPWETKKVSEKTELLSFVHQHVLKPVLTTVSDSVEKCRELSLKILKKYAEIWSKSDLLTHEDMSLIALRLCERINDSPFPEPAEELRLLVVELLQDVVKKDLKIAKKTQQGTEESASLAERLLSTLSKSLTDPFPQVKRAGAETVTLLCRHFPATLRFHWKPVAKALVLNLSHQHSKTRQLTLHALARVLNALSAASYRALLLDENALLLSSSLLQALSQHSLADRTPTVRVELCRALSLVLQARLAECARTHTALLDADLELVSLALQLRGDENDAVRESARLSLSVSLSRWTRERVPLVSEMPDNNEIENAELELRRLQEETEVNVPQSESTAMEIEEIESEETAEKKDVESPPQESSTEHLKAFFCTYLPDIYALVLRDIEASWTVERKCRTLGALGELISLCADESERVTQSAVHTLSVAVRDSENAVRDAAERVCGVLGRSVDSETWLSVCLSRLRGEREGESVAAWAGTVRVLTAIVRGVREIVESETATNTTLTEEERETALTRWTRLAERVGLAVATERLLCQRESALREALLLLSRALVATFPRALAVSQSLRRCLSLSLLFLAVRLTGESDTISLAATKDLAKLALSLSAASSTSSSSSGTPAEGEPRGEKEREREEDEAIALFLSEQFVPLLGRILFPQREMDAATERQWDTFSLSVEIVERERLPAWRKDGHGDNTEKDCYIAAFCLLLRMCYTQAWAHWRLVLPVIEAFAQPAVAEKDGSASANDRHYAAMRGEETVDAAALFADTRLALLALMEELLRKGSAHWESAQALAAAAERVMRRTLAPNLVWRVGRVEATLRKLALSASYALLRAGSLSRESLLSMAQEVVPLLVSQLDDTENTPRLLSALSLAVVCHRLRGAFSEQAVREMYPKLVARLDDSNDEVRIAACATMSAFLRAGEKKEHYSGTTIEYLLEQFFIHLDDVNPSVQDAVLGAIITASLIDKEKVLQRAEENRLSHRSPVLCDRVVREVAALADKSYYD